MNMDDYSKGVEETTMVPNKKKEQMHVIGLERIKYQKEKQQRIIVQSHPYDQKKQIKIEYDS